MGLFSHIGHFFKDVGHTVSHAAHDVGHAVEHAAKDVGHAVSHAAHDVGHAVDHAAHSVGHFISHTAHDVGHSLSHFAHDMGHTVEHAAKDAIHGIRRAIAQGGKILGKIEHVVGAPLRFVVGGIAHAIGDLIGVHMRTLSAQERAVLFPVFGSSLPYDRILLTSISGKDGRAFTVPGSMVLSISALIPVFGPVLALAGLIEHLHDKFLINVGKAAYQNMLVTQYDADFNELAGSELVHESTHVWQGYNGAFSWGYVFNSLYYQAKCGSKAYDVDETKLKQWDDYNVEQQGTVVEHWYSRGSNVMDKLYPFVRDNVRKGNPSAHTNL